MNPPALVAFDLGGTTIHDRGEVPAAFAASLAESGVPFDPLSIGGWRGASKRDVLRAILSRSAASPLRIDDRVAAAYARFEADLRSRIDRAEPLSLPGVRATLERLRSNDIRVALITGFERNVVDLVLARLDWAPLLDAVVTSDEVAEGRPAPDLIYRAMERCAIRPGQAVGVVGDTIRDLEAGLNASARYRIGVLTGAHSEKALRRAPSTHVVASVSEVPTIWWPRVA